jgi:multicomponent Na+:H+ antiporter subunit E
MNYIVVVIIFATVWCALNGEFSVALYLWGLIFGSAALWLVESRAVTSPSAHGKGWKWIMKPWTALKFGSWFLKEVLVANLQVVSHALSPKLTIQPAVIAIPLDVKTDIEIALLANLITLTPGTLSIDVSFDRSTLYIHVMNAKDLESVRKNIKNNFERRVMELLA